MNAHTHPFPTLSRKGSANAYLASRAESRFKSNDFVSMDSKRLTGDALHGGASSVSS